MKIKLGDRVGYSVKFLAAIGMKHSDMSYAKGIVASLKTIGPACVIANVKWEKENDLPANVNVYNLAIVGPNREYCNCD